jgi:hypothetical protein
MGAYRGLGSALASSTIRDGGIIHDGAAVDKIARSGKKNVLCATSTLPSITPKGNSARSRSR